jgi:hypothetical protein
LSKEERSRLSVEWLGQIQTPAFWEGMSLLVPLNLDAIDSRMRVLQNPGDHWQDLMVSVFERTVYPATTVSRHLCVARSLAQCVAQGKQRVSARERWE